jgi:hypothetical protein
MYDEAGASFGGPSGGGITSALILVEDQLLVVILEVMTKQVQQLLQLN